jgi:tetrapyrrole methylase family protein/MazG family protein
MERLVALMAILRSEQGCPWDREQSLESLKPFLLEEAYEVLDAIDSGERDLLEEELGDLLLQVVFQSQLCAEEGSFTFDDVARHITTKLIRRHPHVFGDAVADNPAAVLKTWESVKKKEKEKGGKGPRSAVDGVPRSMPALRRAQQLQHKAARVGFDWDCLGPVLQKIEEELGELHETIDAGSPERIQDELGDLLFAVVNASRFLGVQAEEALDGSIHKFTRRFQAIEEEVHRQGRHLDDFGLAELDAIWDAVKQKEENRG